MKILYQSKELKASELFRMSLDPKIQKMKDNVGLRLEVAAWIIYEDADNDGAERTILSIMDPEGDVYATNSATFRDQFLRIVDMLNGEAVDVIEIISGTSKAGREYVTCSYVGNK